MSSRLLRSSEVLPSVYILKKEPMGYDELGGKARECVFQNPSEESGSGEGAIKCVKYYGWVWSRDGFD